MQRVYNAALGIFNMGVANELLKQLPHVGWIMAIFAVLFWVASVRVGVGVPNITILGSPLVYYSSGAFGSIWDAANVLLDAAAWFAVAVAIWTAHRVSRHGGSSRERRAALALFWMLNAVAIVLVLIPPT